MSFDNALNVPSSPNEPPPDPPKLNVGGLATVLIPLPPATTSAEDDPSWLLDPPPPPPRTEMDSVPFSPGVIEVLVPLPPCAEFRSAPRPPVPT